MSIPSKTTLALLRTGLVWVLTFGLVGTMIELLLLKHTDGIWQVIPLILLLLALLNIAWYGFTRMAAALRVLQFLMLVFLLSGVIGTVQHFLGNVTYERESDPSISGMELYQRAVMGSSPALAPGTMIQLGLIGLLFVFRHPLLVAARREEDST